MISTMTSVPFRRYDRDLTADSLVDMEIKCKARVVLFDDDAGRFLNGLRADTHGSC